MLLRGSGKMFEGDFLDTSAHLNWGTSDTVKHAVTGNKDFPETYMLMMICFAKKCNKLTSFSKIQQVSALLCSPSFQIQVFNNGYIYRVSQQEWGFINMKYSPIFSAP